MTDELMMRMSELQMLRRTDSLMEAGDERLVVAVHWTLDGDRVLPRARVIAGLERQRWTVVAVRRTVVNVRWRWLLEARSDGAGRRGVVHEKRRRRAGKNRRRRRRRRRRAVPPTRDHVRRRRSTALVPRYHPATRPTDSVRATSRRRRLYTANTLNTDSSVLHL